MQSFLASLLTSLQAPYLVSSSQGKFCVRIWNQQPSDGGRYDYILCFSRIIG